jgi:hypothetical protein
VHSFARASFFEWLYPDGSRVGRLFSAETRDWNIENFPSGSALIGSRADDRLSVGTVGFSLVAERLLPKTANRSKGVQGAFNRAGGRGLRDFREAACSPQRTGGY